MSKLPGSARREVSSLKIWLKVERAYMVYGVDGRVVAGNRPPLAWETAVTGQIRLPEGADILSILLRPH